MTGNEGVIRPHGGKLINRIAQKNPSGALSITISEDLANDVENIADGIFSPLEGFLGQQDFESVVSRGRLSNDIPWTVPIVLDVEKETADGRREPGGDLAWKVGGLGADLLALRHGLFGVVAPASRPCVDGIDRACFGRRAVPEPRHELVE